MEKKLVLTVHVTIDRTQVTSFDGPAGSVVMIPFGGTVEGEIFNGVVRPGGVDTQVVNMSGVRHMSARYCLEGIDNTGEPCIIYVDNHGYFTDGDTPHPFKTVPELLTNSKALAPYLHRKAFVGEGSAAPEGVTIRIFELAEE